MLHVITFCCVVGVLLSALPLIITYHVRHGFWKTKYSSKSLCMIRSQKNFCGSDNMAAVKNRVAV